MTTVKMERSLYVEMGNHEEGPRPVWLPGWVFSVQERGVRAQAGRVLF